MKKAPAISKCPIIKLLIFPNAKSHAGISTAHSFLQSLQKWVFYWHLFPVLFYLPENTVLLSCAPIFVPFCHSNHNRFSNLVHVRTRSNPYRYGLFFREAIFGAITKCRRKAPCFSYGDIRRLLYIYQVFNTCCNRCSLVV